MKNKQGGSMLHLELTVVKTMLRIRDGPLENLWGRGGRSTKKIFAQGKIR